MYNVQFGKKGKSLTITSSAFSTQSWENSIAQNAFLNAAKIQENYLWIFFLNYASMKSCVFKNSEIFWRNNIFKESTKIPAGSEIVLSDFV